MDVSITDWTTQVAKITQSSYKILSRTSALLQQTQLQNHNSFQIKNTFFNGITTLYW